MGLSLALRCKEKGCGVYGFDLDEKKLEKINSGKSPILEEFIDERRDLLTQINESNNPTTIKKFDVVIVCVPIPGDETFFLILDPLKGAMKTVIENHKKG